MHQSFGIRRCVAVLAAAACVAQRNQTTTATELGASVPSPAILVALQEGPPGELALREWSTYAGEWLLDNGSATVWVLCTTNEIEAAVRKSPYVQPFLVDKISSWVHVFEEFFLLPNNSHQHTSITGLFGEGSLPHPELSESIDSLQESLYSSVPPTAILTRSRSRGNGTEPERWFSDTLITQIWCNWAMLTSSRLAELGLLEYRTLNTTLLEVLSILLQEPSGTDAVLVDGTQVLRSIFEVGSRSSSAEDTAGAGSIRGKYASGISSLALATGSAGTQQRIAVGSAASTDLKADRPEGNPVHIGRVGLSLVLDDDIDPAKYDGLAGRSGDQRLVRASIIQKSPWPPQYVLETVATKNGLVIVSNVNCGYLDMATNFLMSVRETADAKVRSGALRSTMLFAVFLRAHTIDNRASLLVVLHR